MKNTSVHGDKDVLINKDTKIWHVFEKNIVAIVKPFEEKEKKEGVYGKIKTIHLYVEL